MLKERRTFQDMEKIADAWGKPVLGNRLEIGERVIGQPQPE